MNYIHYLKHKAYKMRVHSLTSTTEAGSGHPTTCLSAADLVAALFFYTMEYDPDNFENLENDRFVLSKGHAAPLLYAAWKEIFGENFSYDINSLRKFDSVLEGHPTPRFPYVEVATGSLGQGLSIATGMALHAKMTERTYYTYVLLGDSELSEGANWEAASLASHNNLDNLIAIADINRLGQSTPTMEGHDLGQHRRKFEAFGWRVLEVDGHNMQEIVDAYSEAKTGYEQPTVILAKTYKGYGINEEIEDSMGFHGKPMPKDRLPHLLENLKKRFSDAADYEPDKTMDFIKRPTHEEYQEEITEFNVPKPTYLDTDEMPTRVAFGNALAQFGEQVPEIVSLDGEVKNSTYAEIFEDAFLNRFVQCFIAEQNMVGMGVGMATCSAIPFCSSFAAFLSRAHDQIRMAAIGRCPVRLVGSHAGVSIGADGPSQMGLEDIAMMRAIPDSLVLYPCDAVSTHHCVGHMITYYDGISYLRTTRMATPIIYSLDEQFPVGELKVLRSSAQDIACVVGAGVTVHEALKAYDQLQKDGIAIRILDCYSIKPLPTEQIREAALQAKKRLIVIEDHYLEGGLGEAIASALVNDAIEVEHKAVSKMPRSGEPEELLAYEGIDAAAIVKTIKKWVK